MQFRICASHALRTSSLLPRQGRRLAAHATSICVLIASLSWSAHAQDGAPVVDPGAAGDGVMQTSYQGASISSAGASYSRALDSVLRARFTTPSYGLEAGQLDLGTFKTFIWNDETVFFADGQVTLSDEQGVGFNVGGGVRYLSETIFTPDPMRITGVSVWADGTSTEADNFFPQVGLSYESLGDLWDFRFNGYAPVGNRTQFGDINRSGSSPVFLGNALAIPTTQSVDRAYYNADLEAALRMGDREAWGFGGGYLLYDGDDDTIGGRMGVRGYAVPDVLLQIAITHDDVFKTNAGFSLTWFVGRTRTDYCATGTVVDRFREPVMRNNYVVVHTTQRTGGIEATDPDGDPLRIVHVNSAAAPGGDGTFESPLSSIDDVFANSMEGDIVFVHAESMFTGESVTLQNDQRFLGEGGGIVYMVNTGEFGTVELPESSLGAADGTKPSINSAVGSAITLADNNEVSNFLIDGNGVTTTAIDGADTNGVTDPNLHDLMIQEIMGNGIDLVAGARVDTDDEDNDGNTTELRIPFAVTIDEVMFDQVTGNDIHINAQADDGGPVDPDDNNVQLVGDMSITNITSTNNSSVSLFVENMNEADTFGKLTVDQYDYDGGGTGLGAMDFQNIDAELRLMNVTSTNHLGSAMNFNNLGEDALVNIDGLDYDGGALASSGLVFTDVNSNNGAGSGVTVSNSTFTGGTGPGVSIRSDVDDTEGIFNFTNTTSFENVDGNTIEVLGDFGGNGTEFVGDLTVASDIENEAGQSVQIANVGGDANITWSGDIEDTGLGVTVNDSTGGTFLFTGDMTIDTTGTPGTAAIALDNNNGADISLNGTLDLTTENAAGFTATNGGELTILNSGNDNTITTLNSTALRIEDMEISNAGVEFSSVTRNAGAGAAGDGIVLVNNESSGTIRIGETGSTTNGDGGTIAANGADNGVVIQNSGSVELNNLQINHGAGATGTGVVVVDSNPDDMDVDLNNVDITMAQTGVSVTGTGGTGTFSFTADGGTILNPSQTGMALNDVDNGTVNINDVTIDGAGNATVAGLSITDSNATFNIDTDTSIEDVDGTAFLVSGGAGTITMQGDIENSVGTAVEITGITGGTVTMINGTVNHSGTSTGIDINNNTGGTINLASTNNIDYSGAGAAVSITGNSAAADITVSDMTIDTTAGSGTGFLANGGGTLTTLGDNIVRTSTGTAIDINGMDIGMVWFDQVDVTNATTNAIVLNNLTGGEMGIGSTGAANTSTIAATGEAIVVNNVANVTFTNFDITASGGTAAVDLNNTDTNAMSVTLDDVNITASAADGVNALSNNTGDFSLTINNSQIGGVTNDALEINTSAGSDVDVSITGSTFDDNVVMNINNSGTFDLLFRNSVIDNATDEVGFELDLDTNVTIANIRIDETGGGTTSITTADATAFDFDATGVSTVNFLISDATITNNSASTAATINADSNTLLNATVMDNIFINPGGEALDVESAGTAIINLNMTGNTANTASNDLNLIETAGTFRVQDLANVDANNPGDVTFTPAMGSFDDFAGDVPQPPQP